MPRWRRDQLIINAHGKPQSISAETKRRLLDAMYQRTATKVAVTPVLNVMVYTSGKMPMVVEGSGEYSWLLTTRRKAGKGHVTGQSVQSTDEAAGRLSHADAYPDDQRTHCRVIVAPETLLRTAGVAEQTKAVGACVQLYTPRSEKTGVLGILAISKRCWWMWQNVAGRLLV